MEKIDHNEIKNELKEEFKKEILKKEKKKVPYMKDYWAPVLGNKLGYGNYHQLLE